MDSRARECENPAYFVILALNFNLGALTIPQSTEQWRIFVISGRIVVPFGNIWVIRVRLFPFIPAHFRRSRPTRIGRDYNSIG